MRNGHMTVKDMHESEKPYEKCEKSGAAVLSDAELLAVVIRCGTRQKRSMELAGEVLTCSEEYPGLVGLHHLTLQELMKIPGIGRVKAIQLLCVAELGKRLASSERRRGLCFEEPRTVAEYYMQELRFFNCERVVMLALDSRNCLIKRIDLSVGTVNASFSNPREIFLTALKHEAVSVILLHNHPSGDPTPGREDMRTTRRVREAGQLIGIPLMDHIIIGDNTYVSFKERGLLDS